MDEEAKSDYVPADEYEEWEQLNKAKLQNKNTMKISQKIC